MSDFAKTIAEAYATEGAALDLGRGVHDSALAPEAVVRIPLRMMNRHGLIAGATGTGKTITLDDSQAPPASAPAPGAAKKKARRKKPEAPAPSVGLDQLGDFLQSREGKALRKQVTRGVFGMLRKSL